MVRNASAVLHNLITSSIFNLWIHSYWIFQSKVQESEIDIHHCSCIIDLGDSEWDEWFSLNSVSFAIIYDSFAYSCTHSWHILPRQGSLEGFSYKVIFESEISQVPNHEGQEISSFSVLSTSPESFVFFGNRVHNFLLVVNLMLRSFKQNSAEGHFIRIKFHNLSYKVFLCFINHFVEFALFFCLQGHTELELLVIHKP